MKKYDNFKHSLENLKKVFEYNEPYSIVELTGFVALYEICFEQSWKSMKEILENHGYNISSLGSPKKILKTAFACGMIKNEELWLEALESRNNATHSYDENIAYSIVEKIKAKYCKMFEELDCELTENWL